MNDACAAINAANVDITNATAVITRAGAGHAERDALVGGGVPLRRHNHRGSRGRFPWYSRIRRMKHLVVMDKTKVRVVDSVFAITSLGVVPKARNGLPRSTPNAPNAAVALQTNAFAGGTHAAGDR